MPARQRGVTGQSSGAPTAATPDWNSRSDFFTFTRGRFLYDEANQIAEHAVRFDMNELARVAAAAVGAERCVAVEKCSDGMFSKAYVMRMSDGQEVIAKVPNPNAGIPHYTTASEVATMDFVRTRLATPAPRVIAWNSRAESSPVGAEYIIMEKASGVPLGGVWRGAARESKFRLLSNLFDVEERWLQAPLPSYGSLYYARDLAAGEALPITDDPDHHDGTSTSTFSIGPACGRDWCDGGRRHVVCDRGPWTTPQAYAAAVGTRERAAIEQLAAQPQEPYRNLRGPGCYRPSATKKLRVLDAYQALVDGRLLPPADEDLTRPRIWHDDLHGENIFVDPEDPARITAIIDWQAAAVAPLTEHIIDPGFLVHKGSVGASLALPPRPDRTGLPEEEAAALWAGFEEHTFKVGWRMLLRHMAGSPAPERALMFHRSTAGAFVALVGRVADLDTEAHAAGHLIQLWDDWEEEKAAQEKAAAKEEVAQQPLLLLPEFPVEISDEWMEEIAEDVLAASRGVELMNRVQGLMGSRYPVKGLVETHQYEEVKRRLGEVRDQIAEEVAEGNEDKRREFLAQWPFDG